MEFTLNKRGQLVVECETLINNQPTPIRGIVRKIAGDNLWLHEIVIIETSAIIAARQLYSSIELAKQQLIQAINIGYIKKPNEPFELNNQES